MDTLKIIYNVDKNRTVENKNFRESLFAFMFDNSVSEIDFI